MATRNESTNNGVGFIGLLTISFIILKLTGVIDWSWFWVLSPLWIPFAAALLLITILLTVKTIATVIEKKDDEDE